jgi:hypothetical protein
MKALRLQPEASTKLTGTRKLRVLGFFLMHTGKSDNSCPSGTDMVTWGQLLWIGCRLIALLSSTMGEQWSTDVKRRMRS